MWLTNLLPELVVLSVFGLLVKLEDVFERLELSEGLRVIIAFLPSGRLAHVGDDVEIAIWTEAATKRKML